MIFITFSLLLGCSQNKISSEEDHTNVEEELNFDEQFFISFKNMYGKDKEWLKLVDLFQKDIEKIKDEKIKEEIIELLEKTIYRITEEGIGSENLRYHFFSEGPQQIAFEEHLTEATIENIYLSAYPIYYGLDKENLIMVHEKFNEVIKIEESSREALWWLEDNDIEYESIVNNSSKIIVLSETGVIVQYDDIFIINVFKIENKQGENMDPHIALKDISEKIIEKESKRPKLSEEEINEFSGKKNVDKKEIERKKEEGPQIGMIDTEVADLFGKPRKINRTTTATGVREQWVYPNGTYLYFENELLTTIQE